ncbi:MAG: ABC transporter substrate-binding protein, partial [Pseudomonadota bacterium]
MKMKRIILLSVIFTFVYMISIASKVCQASEGIKRGITDDTIKIGAIMDLTGMASATTSIIVEAFRNYADHVNDNGGINGRKLKIIVEDDRFTISGGVAAFKKLIYRDNIFLLLGPGSSGESAALKNQFIKEKLPAVPFSANQDLVRPFERYIFLPLDTLENQIGVILDYILETTKIKNPKIVNAVIDTGSKTPVLKTFRAWEKYWGIKVRDLFIPLNVLDATSEILTLKREGADYIIVTHTIPCAALLLKDAKRYGLDAKVYGTSSLTSEDVIRIAGPLAKDFYGVKSVSSWYDDTPGVEEMRKITLKHR